MKRTVSPDFTRYATNGPPLVAVSPACVEDEVAAVVEDPADVVAAVGEAPADEVEVPEAAVVEVAIVPAVADAGTGVGAVWVGAEPMLLVTVVGVPGLATGGVA